jgi:branched-chain amino acid transport system substrate-binding protein
MKKHRLALVAVSLTWVVLFFGLLYSTGVTGFAESSMAPMISPDDLFTDPQPPAAGIICSEPVTVAVMTDLTGPLATYGTHIERSFPLGMEYGTGAPGVGGVYMLEGCEIRVIWGDDQSDATIADAVARELVEDEGAVILVGTVSSAVTATLQELANEYDILHIAAPAASNDITGIHFSVNTFRTSRNTYQDAVNLCEYVGSQHGTVVQIAPDMPFGRTTAAIFRDACRFLGVDFAADDILAPIDTVDFVPYMQQVLASGADACIITWAGSGFVSLLQAAVDQGVIDQMDLALSFSDNASIPGLFDPIVGTTGGILYHYTLPGNEINDWLVVETQARYGTPPDLFYADGMNAALLIVEALRATDGDTSIEGLIAAMEGIEFQGPKGTIAIRPEDHVAIQDMYNATLLNVDDPDYDFFELVDTNRPTTPCLLPPELWDRCDNLPIGSLVRTVSLPVVLRNR